MHVFSRRNTFGVKAALDSSDGDAVGALFWDDGESIGLVIVLNFIFLKKILF